jgi:hypothetical protein
MGWICYQTKLVDPIDTTAGGMKVLELGCRVQHSAAKARQFCFQSTHMKQFEFRLHLTEQQYLHYYRGSVNQVIVKSFCGATIQFPASLLTRFVSVSGVRGHFVLTCDDACKGSEIRRVV